MSRGSLHTFVQDLCQQLSDGGQAGLPDAALLDRWIAQRDEAAFELLVRRHGSMVLGVCRRVLRDGPDVEDAFQATFLLLIRKAAGIRQRHALGAWLHKVALRVALRARAARRRVPEIAEEVAAPLEKDELLWRDLRPVLDEEINGLPDRYRLPFVLCNLEGKTDQEAADALGCPVGTILSRLHWARGRLRARLERRGVTVALALLTVLLERHAAPAAVPAPLIESCFRAVLSSSSTGATALASGVLRSMFLTKLKWTTAILAVCCVLSLSAWKLSESATAAPVPQIPDKKEPPTATPPSVDQPAPPRDWVLVPTQVKGRIALVARELRDGEKAPDDRFVTTLEDGKKRYYRLKEGDRVEKGELLGRIDDRLARNEVEIKKAKLEAAEAELASSTKTREEAKVRHDRLLRLMAQGAVPAEEVSAAKLTWERYIEEAKGKKSSIEVAQRELIHAKIILEMHEIRSPVRGVIQSIQKKQGEAASELEGVIRIKVEEK